MLQNLPPNSSKRSSSIIENFRLLNIKFCLFSRSVVNNGRFRFAVFPCGACMYTSLCKFDDSPVGPKIFSGL